MRRFKITLLQVIVSALFLGAWQGLAIWSKRVEFLLGSPYLVFCELLAKPSEWLSDSFITGVEALLGFVLGVSIGSAVGFGLLYSRNLSVFSRPFIISAGAIPIFAIAPMLIIWFGTGIWMKIASAFFATVLVSLSQAYEGGKNIDPSLRSLFLMSNASSTASFRKLVLPCSLDWVFASLRLNVGFSLLGAFIGEFIASNAGLGHEILSAGGVYDFPRVFAATLCIILLALALNASVGVIERNRHQIIEKISVPQLLWKRTG